MHSGSFWYCCIHNCLHALLMSWTLTIFCKTPVCLILTSTLLLTTDSDRDHFRLCRRLHSDLHIPPPAVFPYRHTFACKHRTYTVHIRASRFVYHVHSLRVRHTFLPMKHRAPS